ncbi:MAG: DUF106 domain-containing protein [Candidatus Aenigmarchaeota archaeon]|nr:DUF106 domain-containing protein [Candidatus Aenigmarchaeota archaeon]
MVFGLPGYQEVLIISLVLSLIMVLLTKFLTNQDEIRKAKREMKFYQDKIKKAQKSEDKEAVSKLSKDMLKASSKQMKQSMKPMFVSLIIFVIALGWLTGEYGELLINLPITLPVLGNQLNWFWWYLIIVLPTSFIFRKMLGVE